ncbi:hypothetical protein [Candidatus Protochlamydia phocaeensis]|uniref:hypothetical protein n=1 Tax=Candidatus Protochlamydia phocaeensis TaxID=1414722 RepID=UPI0008399D9D|nr:hypothetical protein [Candidatus Protochlamydia phocaeensis]
MNIVNHLRSYCQSTATYFNSSKTSLFLNEKVKEASSEVFSALLPNFYTLCEMNKYPYMSELMLGSFCTAAGCYTMYTSYAIGKVVKQEAPSNAAFRKACALGGALCATYGVYTLTTLALKVFSDFVETGSLQDENHFAHSYVHYNGPYSANGVKEQASENLDRKAQKFLDVFLSCPDAKKVYEKVTKDGPIQIRFVDPSLDEMVAKSHGYWNIENREIVIDSTSGDLQQFHILIYEMLNASRSKAFSATFEEAAQGTLDALEFAKQLEKGEYETTKGHCYVTANCVASQAWSFLPKARSIEQCNELYNKGFEERWEEIKDRPHTQIYIDMYNERFSGSKMKTEKDEL